MTAEVDSLGRIAKLLIDRDNMTIEEAGKHLSEFRVLVRCGPEIAWSPTLQAAALTAINIASRCFPGSVRVLGVGEEPLLVPWLPERRLRDAICEIGGAGCLERCDDLWGKAINVVLGGVTDCRSGV
jgi:hypothetical protein